MKTWWRRSSSPLSPDSGRRLAERQGRGGPRPESDRGSDCAAGQVNAGLVDAHVHVFPAEMIRGREAFLERDTRFEALYRSPGALMATADDVVRQMEESGVDLAVLVGFAFADQGLCRMVNDYVLDAVGKHPDCLAGLACVAPSAAGAAAELERCLDAGLRGCGELVPDRSGYGLDTVAGVLRERGLPLLVHASEPLGHNYPGKGRFTPDSCLALAGANPGLTIVFAHLGGGLFLYETMPEVRAALAGVYYDTAAVPYLYGPEIYQAALLCAGPGKLIFGSDYPLLGPARYKDGLDTLLPVERAAVQSGNARKVYRV